jgi:CHAT domain-containing protein
VQERTGAEADEQSFKALAPKSSLMHLATHAFFYEGDCASGLSEAHRMAREGRLAGQEPKPVLGESPLLLSGLALAGANQRLGGSRCQSCEDGILTAEEIGSLDLSGVGWAVLSSCDTGVGRIEAGEGVLGLRRAFHVAGVKTLIMSLWKVDDESTREWMRYLYEGRLRGMTTVESVQNASLTLLKQRRARGKSTHPFTWGAFVAAGDWR